MTVSSCLEALKAVRLSRYDVVILSLGVNESLRLETVPHWAGQLTHLLDLIEQESPAATEIVVLSIPYSKLRSGFPRVLSHVVDRRAAQMNAASETITMLRDRARYLPFGSGDEIESDGAHAYDSWARGIAPAISGLLAPHWGTSGRTEVADERGRQDSLDALGLLDMPTDKILDEIVLTARGLFGTALAGVTLIDRERQFMASAAGIDAQDISRKDAFCDITIRRPEHFVIEDTLLDPRFSTNPAVTGEPHIRFYAGYPIESPDGQRIGALCIMDTTPHRFTARDATLLRDLAQRAQTRLWALSNGRRP